MGNADSGLSISRRSAQGAEPEDIKYNSPFVTRSGGVLKRSLRIILSRTAQSFRTLSPPAGVTRAHQTKEGHALARHRNRRRASGKPTSTTRPQIPSIGKTAWTQALPLGDLNSACQDGDGTWGQPCLRCRCPRCRRCPPPPNSPPQPQRRSRRRGRSTLLLSRRPLRRSGRRRWEVLRQGPLSGKPPPRTRTCRSSRHSGSDGGCGDSTARLHAGSDPATPDTEQLPSARLMCW